MVPVALTSLIAGPAIVVILIAYFLSMAHMQAMSYTALRHGSGHVMDKLVSFLETASYTAAINAAFVAENGADPDFMARFAAMTEAEIKQHPYFQLIYFGDGQGNHWLQKQEQDGLVHMRVIQRLSDTPEARQRFQEALELSRRAEEQHDRVQERLAPVLKTVWYQKGATGRLVLQAQDPVKVYDPRLRPWYVGALKNGQTYWTDVYTWEENYQEQTRWQMGVTVSSPVARQGTIIGVTAIDIVLKDIADFLQSLTISPHSRIFIFDEQGAVVALPGAEGGVTLDKNGTQVTAHRMRMDQVADPAILNAFLEFTRSQDKNISPAERTAGRVFHFEVDHADHVGHVVPLVPEFGLNWYIAVIAPEADFSGETTRMLFWSMAIALLFIVLLAFLGVRLGFFLTHPINQVIQEIKRLVQHDLRPGKAAQTVIQEFGFLSFVFAKMRTTLHSLISDISSRSHLLDNSFQILSQASDRVATEIDAAREAIGQVRTLSEGVSVHMNDAAAMMEEMDSKMKRVIREMTIMSENMDIISNASTVYSVTLGDVASSSEHARSNLNLLGMSVQEANVGVASATHSVGEISEALARIRHQCNLANAETEQGRVRTETGLSLVDNLAGSLKKIKLVVEFIGDVAERINMLSLNARIEAASAGEFGQGFAVVAHEVRELSQHTARSASTIAESVGELEENFLQVSQFMQEMASKMGGLSLYNREILGAVAVQSVAISGIEGTMEHLSHKTDLIAERMNGSMEGVSEVSSKVQQISQAIADVTQSIVKASSDVARMAPLIDQTTRNTWNIFVRVEETARSSVGITAEIATIEKTVADLKDLGSQVRDRAEKLTSMASAMKEEVSLFQI
ncbi:MAG: methyl-accepting chemotaxis protein [Magnetococcales bacterium]|nr:methyl-accepting chemotaxis protein [Magnetococcales bacterium]